MNRQALGFLAVLGTEVLGTWQPAPWLYPLATLQGIDNTVPSFQERFIGWVGYSLFKWGEGMGSVSKDMPQPPKTDL